MLVFHFSLNLFTQYNGYKHKLCVTVCEAPDRQHSNRSDNHPTDLVDHSIQPILLITQFNRSYRSLNSTDPTDHSIQLILPITQFNRSY